MMSENDSCSSNGHKDFKKRYQLTLSSSPFDEPQVKRKKNVDFAS